MAASAYHLDTIEEEKKNMLNLSEDFWTNDFFLQDMQLHKISSENMIDAFKV